MVLSEAQGMEKLFSILPWRSTDAVDWMFIPQFLSLWMLPARAEGLQGLRVWNSILMKDTQGKLGRVWLAMMAESGGLNVYCPSQSGVWTFVLQLVLLVWDNVLSSGSLPDWKKWVTDGSLDFHLRLGHAAPCFLYQAFLPWWMTPFSLEPKQDLPPLCFF